MFKYCLNIIWTFMFFWNVNILCSRSGFNRIHLSSSPAQLVARGQSTVDEFDRRLRPDRSILPLIDSADNRCVDKRVLPSKDGLRMRDYYFGDGDLLESISRARPPHAKLPVRLSTPYKHPRAHPSRVPRVNPPRTRNYPPAVRGIRWQCLRDAKKLWWYFYSFFSLLSFLFK